MKRPIVTEVIALLFEILFLYTAISKIIDYYVFKEQIAMSSILAPVSGIIAWGLPKIEIIVVILLFLPHFRLKGFYASFILMTIFTIYITGILLLNKHLPCSCGGIISELSWPQHLLFNVIFSLLAWVGIKIEKQIQKEKLMVWESIFRY